MPQELATALAALIRQPTALLEVATTAAQELVDAEHEATARNSRGR